jgi:hypothetical protein
MIFYYKNNEVLKDPCLKKYNILERITNLLQRDPPITMLLNTFLRKKREFTLDFSKDAVIIKVTNLKKFERALLFF